LPRYLVQDSAGLYGRIAESPTAEDAVRVVLDQVAKRDLIFPMIASPIDDDNARRFEVSAEYKINEV
jgi:hypothetical protein